MKSNTPRLTVKPLLLLVTGVSLGIAATFMISLLLPPNKPVTAEYRNEGNFERSIPVSSHVDDAIVNTAPEAGANTLILVVNQIEEIFKQVQSVERLAALYQVISQLDNRTLKDLLSHSADLQWDVSSQNQSELQTAVIERLATMNLQDAIEFVSNREDGRFETSPSLISTIVEAITLSSEGTASGFTPIGDVSRTLAYRLIAKNHTHIPFKRRRELATQIDLATNFIRLYLESLDTATLDDSQLIGRADRDDVLSIFSDIDHLIEILKQWYSSRGVELLDDMRMTLGNHDVEEVITSIVLEQIATKEPTRALEYILTKLSTETQLLAAEEVIREWATMDPSGAFTAVNDLQDGHLKKQLQYSVVYSWAITDPIYVLENLSSFPLHTQIDGASNAIGSLGANSPDRAVAWLRQISDLNMLRAAANTLLSVWSRTDLNAVQKWVFEEPVIASIRTDLFEPLAYRMVASDPLGALALARKHPLATGQVGVEATIFHEIALQDIEVALNLLPNVRAGQKKFAYGAVGSAYVKNREFQKAVDLGLQLDASAHGNYYQYISYIWVNTDADRLYETLPELPNEEARSKAAYALCVLNDGNDYFSKAQVGILVQCLTAEDQETLGPLEPSNDP